MWGAETKAVEEIRRKLANRIIPALVVVEDNVLLHHPVDNNNFPFVNPHRMSNSKHLYVELYDYFKDYFSL